METGERDKCFVIMPISDQVGYENGHFSKVYEQIIIPAVEAAGFQPYRVDENKISDSIIGKIFDAIQNCPMAICDLSNANPNVLYESGLRQAYDKPVVLIQDERTKRIFDVSGINTILYKSSRLYEDVLEAREEIKQAIIATHEGKTHSVVQIVNAKTAYISNEAVSDRDRIEILLQQIFSAVSDLKDGGIIHNKSNSKISEGLAFYNTQDIDSKQIENLINMIATMESGTVKVSSRDIDSVYSLLLELKEGIEAIRNESTRNKYYQLLSNLDERLKKMNDLQSTN